jgi:hypothetical protein
VRNTIIGIVLVLFVVLLPKGIAGMTSRLFHRPQPKPISSRTQDPAPDKM